MKRLRKELRFEAPARRPLINISPQVTSCLQESEVKDSLVLLSTKHS
jgi:thiamine phosphate synthase YjbQ (UPF0047 family)